MEKFEQILRKYNCTERTEKPKISIEEIENIFKFKLPDDYKAYLLNYSSFESHIGQEYIQLLDIDELIETNETYGIINSLNYTLAIGGNGGGEYIAIEWLDKDYRIVLSPYMDLDSQYHIEIGKSFSDFLVRLENGEEWFKEE